MYLFTGHLIGVHCTHGLNRTGYLICRYLIDRMGWSAARAIRSWSLFSLSLVLYLNFSPLLFFTFSFFFSKSLVHLFYSLILSQSFSVTLSLSRFLSISRGDFTASCLQRSMNVVVTSKKDNLTFNRSMMQSGKTLRDNRWVKWSKDIVRYLGSFFRLR